jgi:hypothetical protein
MSKFASPASRTRSSSATKAVAAVVRSIIERYIAEMNGLDGRPPVKTLGLSHMYSLRMLQRSPIGAISAPSLTKGDVIAHCRMRKDAGHQAANGDAGLHLPLGRAEVRGIGLGRLRARYRMRRCAGGEAVPHEAQPDLQVDAADPAADSRKSMPRCSGSSPGRTCGEEQDQHGQGGRLAVQVRAPHQRVVPDRVGGLGSRLVRPSSSTR